MSGRISLQGMYLGPVGTVAGFNEASLPTALAGQLGKVFEVGDKKYRLVKHKGQSVTTASGHAAYWYSKATYEVTGDYDGTEGTINVCAGGYLGVITDGYYCFIQCGGDQTTVKCAAATAIGDVMVCSGVDGILIRMPAGGNFLALPVAVALSNVSSSTSTVRWLPSVLA